MSEQSLYGVRLEVRSAAASIASHFAWLRFQELSAGATRVRSWTHAMGIDIDAFPHDGCEVGLIQSGETFETRVFHDDLVTLHVQSSTGWASVTLAARTDESARCRALEVETFLAGHTPDPSTTPFTLWRAGRERALDWERHIATPAWEDIRANYASHVGRSLDHLMGLRQPGGSGRLMLWHGEPGTGKTTAIRALARRWSDWCTAHLVTDPEVFFGRADYLVDVITSAGKDPRAWTLIVAEDTDEFLRAQQGRNPGAGLSRLLNLSDGILGQGMNVLVLLTTNEPLDRLHPAVARPGRCLANVEFTRMDAAEAATWLGCDGLSTPRTLAELFLERGDLPAHTAPAPRSETGLYL